MDWNALRTFLAIARNGSLSGAARDMLVNHSTVFRRLNQFEEQVGTRLFERLNEGYRLTTAGEALLPKAEQISELFDGLERDLAGQDYQPRGTVRITAPYNIATHFLPRHLRAFNLLYPEIQVELIASNEAFNLSRREADIAVRATRKPPEHLIGRKVCTLGWGVYAQDSSQLTSQKAGEVQSQTARDQTCPLPTNLDELQHHRLIGADGTMAQVAAFRWLDDHNPQQIVARSNDLLAMAALAKQGYGLALLPDDQLSLGLKRLFTFDPGGQSDFWLLCHPDLRGVERIRLLMAYLAECFPGWGRDAQ